MSRAGRLLSLFRVFLPSWKFFDGLAFVPRLSYRLREDDEWIPCPIHSARSPFRLFVNGPGNLAHACFSLVERLLQDANEISAEELESTVSYRLVLNLVRSLIPAAANEFQFRIALFEPGSLRSEDVLISRMHSQTEFP